MSKEKVLKELQEFHECFYDESKANTAELKRKRIEEYIEKSHKVLYEMHEEKLALFDELEELKKEISDRQETEESLGKELIKLGDELEELKRDVKRYSELTYREKWDNDLTDKEKWELAVLKGKLMKVGTEE